MRSAPALRALVLGCVVLAATSSIASAQRGGGGGGGGGGRGGSRGGGGAGASAPNPMQRVRDQLKESDQLEFLDKKAKQLELTKEQKESLKALRKDMQETEKPLFKDLEKTFAEQERSASQGASAGGDPAGGARGGRGGMPAGARETMLKLTEIQDAAGERAHALLNDGQKHMSDSLLVIYKAELRDKETKRSRSSGFGGRG